MPDRHHHHHHHHHWRDRDGYAYRAGAPGPGPNIHRLRRHTRRGKVAGVCAGLADYLGWNVTWLRIGWILAAIFIAPPTFIVIYIIAAIAIKPARQESPAYRSTEEERFWRTFSTRPKATFSELKHRFRAIETRIADLESAVTSDEYGLRKAFRDLERGA